jgi:signal transduction histidine kinase
VSVVHPQPVLADVADGLSDQLRILLKRLSLLLRPETDRLETRFLSRLESLNFDIRQRRALASITLGGAARFLARGCPPSDFFEEVDYNGKRLAKLNLPPTAILVALGEYDKLLVPLLKKLLPQEHHNFQWVREQFQFCVMLTLNNAYYNVREGETQAFYEMFWAELESRNLDELLERFLAILARFCKADEARLYLFEGVSNCLTGRASYGTSLQTETVKCTARIRRDLSQARSFGTEQSGGLLLDGGWLRFPTCWSVPLVSRGKLAGVLQFAFARPYDWLPREQELLTAAAERCMLAIDKARMIEDLDQRQIQIRRLAERIMHVEEAERRRISRELHDQTGQDLLCIRLQMEMLEQELPDEQKSRLAGLRDLTEKTILEIRRLIGALSPAVLEQIGLAAAVRQMVNRFRQIHNSKVKMQFARLGPLPKKLEVIAYRLVQECLNNIAKHSYCSNVMISLSSADGRLRLCVEDDGVGFDVEEALQKPGSFGLAGIRERVALLGGQCEVVSRPALKRPAIGQAAVDGGSPGEEINRGKPNDKDVAVARGNAKGKGAIKSIAQTGKTRGKHGVAPGTRITVELPVSVESDPVAERMPVASALRETSSRVFAN